MRRLVEIVREMGCNEPGDADHIARAWLTVHAAERHMADVHETVACLASLVPDIPAARVVAQWLAAEAERHMDVIHACIVALAPTDMPRDAGWEREGK